MEAGTSNRQRELAERYSALRKEKSILESKLAVINCELTGTEDNPGGLTAEIVQLMVDSNLKTVKFDDLGSITLLEPTPRPKYAKESEATVFEFVTKNGGEGIIKPSIHPSTFSSFIKELLKNGTSIPDYIQVFFQPSIRYTAAKEK